MNAYIYDRTCINTYTHTYIHAYTYRYTYEYACIYTYIYTYIQARTFSPDFCLISFCHFSNSALARFCSLLGKKNEATKFGPPAPDWEFSLHKMIVHTKHQVCCMYCVCIYRGEKQNKSNISSMYIEKSCSICITYIHTYIHTCSHRLRVRMSLFHCLFSY